MGRHSAPSEDAPDDDAATLTIAPESDPPTGRHAAVDAAAEDAADLAETATMIIAAPEAEPAATAAAPDQKAAAARIRQEQKAAAKQQRRERKAARGETNTRADLRMLRNNRAVRLQCFLVVLIAFGGYTAVMLGLGRGSNSYLRWIWIPIVLSGVLVGACLDLAHRRAARRADADPDRPDA